MRSESKAKMRFGADRCLVRNPETQTQCEIAAGHRCEHRTTERFPEGAVQKPRQESVCRNCGGDRCVVTPGGTTVPCPVCKRSHPSTGAGK